MFVKYRPSHHGTLERENVYPVTEMELVELNSNRSTLWQSFFFSCLTTFLGALFTFLNVFSNKGEVWIQLLIVFIGAFAFGIALLSGFLWKIERKKNIHLEERIKARLVKEETTSNANYIHQSLGRPYDNQAPILS